MTARPPRVDRVVVLVTGMSGTGKSTALAALATHGHAVLDTDDPGWITEARTPHGPERLWAVAALRAHLAAHRAGALFVAGCVVNQGELYDAFDAVVVLTAPLAVLLARVVDRDNPYGAAAGDRDRIARDVADHQPTLLAGATHEIRTTVPPAEVVAALEAVARAAGRPEEDPRMVTHDPRVDDYLAPLPPWQQDVCRRLRALVHEADPAVEETIKRTVQPYFVLDGNVCALLAAKTHVNLFLYDGAIVPDPDGIITGGHDNTTARTVAFHEGDPIPEAALLAMLRQLVAKNRAGGWRTIKARSDLTDGRRHRSPEGER